MNSPEHHIKTLRIADSWREYLREIEKMTNARQAIIDQLMLEYCPDDMTKKQVIEWEKHQAKVGV